MYPIGFSGSGISLYGISGFGFLSHLKLGIWDFEAKLGQDSELMRKNLNLIWVGILNLFYTCSSTEDFKLSTLAIYRIVLAPARRPYRIGPLITHENNDFGAFSATERSYAAPILKVDRHISDRCLCHSRQQREQVLFKVIRCSVD